MITVSCPSNFSSFWTYSRLSISITPFNRSISAASTIWCCSRRIITNSRACSYRSSLISFINSCCYTSPRNINISSTSIINRLLHIIIYCLRTYSSGCWNFSTPNTVISNFIKHSACIITYINKILSWSVICYRSSWNISITLSLNYCKRTASSINIIFHTLNNYRIYSNIYTSSISYNSVVSVFY
jgi:hypothetical protein